MTLSPVTLSHSPGVLLLWMLFREAVLPVRILLAASALSTATAVVTARVGQRGDPLPGRRRWRLVGGLGGGGAELERSGRDRTRRWC